MFGICDNYSATALGGVSAFLCCLATINDSCSFQMLDLPPQSIVNGTIAATVPVSIQHSALLRPLAIEALDNRKLFLSQPISYILRIEPNGPANVKGRQCAVGHHFINVLVGNSQEFCYFLNG
jgi:hypothetical protein